VYRFTLSIALIASTLLLAEPKHPRDFRGIGRSDELLYYYGIGQSYTALSDGSSGYQYVPNLFSRGFDTLRTGDFNGDGKSDLILYNANVCFGCFINFNAYIGFSNGDGTFSFQSLFWSPRYTVVETGDINGDGKTDVLLFKPGSLDIGLSDGKGGFTYTHYLVFQSEITAKLVDLNGDGKADLLMYDGDYFIAGVSNGDGTFAFTTIYPFYGSPFYGTPSRVPGFDSMAVGDLNGDGKPDVFLYNAQTGAALTGVNAGGIFTWHAVQLNQGFTTLRIANNRLILYSSFAGDAYIATPDSSWNYSLQPLPWGPGYHTVVTEDVDGDGFDDVILYNRDTGTSYTGLWLPISAACVGCPQGGFGRYTYAYWGLGALLVDELTINTAQ
jgi:hypothetical protein